MTHKQIDAMEAGLEMDRAVAEAIGCAVEFWMNESFRPSTDMNDAMFAAEAFGLFEAYSHDCFMQSIEGNDLWSVRQRHKHAEELAAAWGAPGFPLRPEGWADVADGTTAPLAICRAILTLASTNH